MIFEGIDLGPSTPETRAQSAKRFAGYALSLARRRPMKRSAMKRAKPKGIPLSVRAALAERCQGLCERCGEWVGDAFDPHHRIKRSQGGTDTLDVLAALCRRCHDDVEAHPAQAVADGWTVQKGKAAA